MLLGKAMMEQIIVCLIFSLKYNKLRNQLFLDCGKI